MAKKKIDWNMGSDRVKQISILVGKLREAYIVAKLNRDQDSLASYHTFLDALWREVRQFVVVTRDKYDADEKETLSIDGDERPVQNWLDYFENRVDSEGFNKGLLNKLRRVDDRVQDVRQDVIPDIPRSVRSNPETAFADQAR